MDATDISRGVEKIPIPLASPEHLLDASDFVYVLCNIPGPQTPRDEFREQIEGCSCDSTVSCSGKCPCVSRFGPSYDEHHRLTSSKVDPYQNFQQPIYECNAACRCGDACSNRVVQHGVQVHLEVFRTEQKGFGLRTLDAVSRYSFVCEYAGEVLTYEDAKKRTQALNEVDSANYYILAVKEHLGGGGGGGSGEVLTTYVDPMYVGNVGRFVNHSCDPNLFMIPVRIHNTVPRMGLFALRDIAAGEELTFEYSGSIQGGGPDGNNGGGGGSDAAGSAQINGSSEGAQTPVVNFQKRTCCCGAPTCRGFLPFDETLYAE